MKESLEIMTGTLIDDDRLLTLADLCRACGVHAEVITDMVEYGIIEPSGDTAGHWQSSADKGRQVVMRIICISSGLQSCKYWRA
jgi:chaperone modulatory protein CbpM